LSYQPKPGSNIDLIYHCLSTTFRAYDEIKKILAERYPQVPENSLHTHLKFLCTKKLVAKVAKSGVSHYKLTSTPEPLPQMELIEHKHSVSQCVLDCCKAHVGKRIKSGIIKTQCGNHDADNAPLTLLKRLKDNGYIQLIPDTRPYEYLVLPEIKTLDKMGDIKDKKTPIKDTVTKEEKYNVGKKEKTIADMSIGEIVQGYMTMEVENTRLREALQRIAHELVQIGEIE